MSAQKRIKRITVPRIAGRKGGVPLVCLTAYTTPMAEILDAHADLLLIGDSVGMVLHGMDNTLGVTLEMMIMHGRAVARGAKRACVILDMPFGSYEESPQVAFRNSVRVLRETGCAGVKLEGGVEMAATVRFLVSHGIPVMGHVGLLPQSVHARGGYRAHGRSRAEWQAIIDDAIAIDEAGAFSMVVEGVAEPLGREITKAVRCPTIGIGASRHCDGQILVTEDLLGLFEKNPPFVKRYAETRKIIEGAVESYAREVKARKFPAPRHTYKMKK